MSENFRSFGSRVAEFFRPKERVPAELLAQVRYQKELTQARLEFIGEESAATPWKESYGLDSGEEGITTIVGTIAGLWEEYTGEDSGRQVERIRPGYEAFQAALETARLKDIPDLLEKFCFIIEKAHQEDEKFPRK